MERLKQAPWAGADPEISRGGVGAKSSKMRRVEAVCASRDDF